MTAHDLKTMLDAPDGITDWATGPEQSLPNPERRMAVLTQRFLHDSGERCPREGWWFTPAGPGSRRHFKLGEVMPKLSTDYGRTIWQWDAPQAS